MLKRIFSGIVGRRHASIEDDSREQNARKWIAASRGRGDYDGVRTRLAGMGLEWFANVLIKSPVGIGRADYLVRTSSGVVVIVHRNYSGKILGSLRDEEWTQIVLGTHRERFPNPFKQLGRATAAVHAHGSMSVVQGLVVFSNHADISAVASSSVVRIEGLPTWEAARNDAADGWRALIDSTRTGGRSNRRVGDL